MGQKEMRPEKNGKGINDTGRNGTGKKQHRK